jgi:hypothetical protein
MSEEGEQVVANICADTFTAKKFNEVLRVNSRVNVLKGTDVSRNTMSLIIRVLGDEGHRIPRDVCAF